MKKPFNYQLFYRRAALIAYDIVSVIASSFLAILIRYDFQLNTVPEEFMLPIRQFMLLDIVLALGIFYLFRLYHSLWAFAGETELQNLVMACLTASVADGIGINFFHDAFDLFQLQINDVVHDSLSQGNVFLEHRRGRGGKRNYQGNRDE